MLGGGVGGITSAFELTATPELRERFEVTVYQLGWRIGGKGASGRNAAVSNRIEEHGLHIWFGFYDNAFRVMRDAYQELGRPTEAPLATLDDAFKPCDQLVLYDRPGDRWHAHRFEPPRNLQRPGDPGDLPTFWEMAATACQWALGGWRGVREDRPELDRIQPPSRFTPAWFADLARDVAVDLLRTEFRAAEHLLALALRLARARARRTDLAHAEQAAHHWFLVRLLTSFRDWLWAHVVSERQDDPGLRLFFTMFDTLASTVAGLVKDGVLQHGFDAINDQEWCEWLRRNGAKEITLGRTPAERSPLLRSVYDVAFGYPDGDIDKANVAAGTAINDLLRLLFSYRGSVMYKMQAGMGDVVFTPLYEVLKQRGVRFEFFHAVTGLGLAPDTPRIDSIDVARQVELRDGDGYDPLVDVDGLACWPSEPKWDRLLDGKALQDGEVDFELDPNPLGRPSDSLIRGTDFDQVVLAIPVGALRPICSELIERDERFNRAIETAVTVRTQAFQVWAGRPSGELGWEHDTNSVAGCYVEPLDTYCDMSHLIGRESWGDEDGVQAIGYFCGVLPEEQGEKPADATAHAKDNAIEFLERDVGTLWPATGSAGPGTAFDWGHLVDREGRPGRERFDAQYWRANASPSERYVLTTAGSVEHRLPSDDSGFENLVLAGDWTKNGIDGGCVEAAVISGMQAARGLIKVEPEIAGKRPIEVQRPIIGEDLEWVTPEPQGLPPYVEYGGRATSPGPFLSLGGSLRGFVLDADADRISRIVRRTLNAPAGRGVDYRALGSRVLLLVGGFERVSSMTAPFDRWGTVREIQASFWIPVVAGDDRGDVFVAERFGLAIPYIFVDNAMSYLGGRENYGYAKTLGRFEPSGGVGDRMHLDTFGGNFGRNEGADWHPILDIEAVTETGGRPRNEPIEGPDHLIRFFAGDLLHRNPEGEVVIPGMRLTRSFVDDVRAKRMRQVFLKQFRDAADGTRACYQSVVETPIEVQHLSIRPSRREWDVTLHPLDSHPIKQEIGVASQRASLAFEGELDMVVKNGIEIGRVAAATGVPAAVERPSDGGAPIEGVTGLVESVARRVLGELSSLERRLTHRR